MRTLIIAAVLCMLCPGSARAQVKSGDFKRDIARTQYKLGAKYYEVGEYPRAMAAFKEAYRLTKLAGLLYNIGRCHELLGETAEAIKLYRQYLQERPNASNASVLKVKIENLQKALDEKKKPAPVKRPPVKPVKPAPAPEVDPPGKVVVKEEPVPATPTDRRRGGWDKTTGWIGLGLGGGALVAGAVLGSMVSSAESDYENATGKTWPELQAMKDSGRAKANASTALFITGGVLAAAGSGLLIYHYLIKKEEHQKVTLLPLGGSVFGVAARGRF